MQLGIKHQILCCHGTNRRAGLSKSTGQSCRPTSVCAAADSSKQPPPVYIEDSATQTFLNWATSAGIQFPKLKVGTTQHHRSAHAVLSSCLGHPQQQPLSVARVLKSQQQLRFAQQPRKLPPCYTCLDSVQPSASLSARSATATCAVTYIVLPLLCCIPNPALHHLL